MAVALNKPPYRPKPLSKKDIFMLFNPIIIEQAIIIIVSLEYKMDLSRLRVTALDSNKKRME